MNSICGRVALVVCACAFALAACSSRNLPNMVVSPNEAAQSVLHATPYVRLMAETSPVNRIAGFTLRSTDFKNGCRGESLPPALSWTNAPPGTKSFALVLFDETANFGHWGIYNVSPNANHLTPGVKQVMNDAGVQGYVGPCPPPGIVHRYVFTIYALDTTLNLEDNSSLPPPDVESLLNAMMGHVLGRASITGLLQKT